MKAKKTALIIMFIAGLALFGVSLAPFFREFTDKFWIAAVVGVVAAGLALFALLHRPRRGGVTLSSEYKRKGVLISRPEYNFLQTLRQISPSKYEVLPQVALVSVIDKKTNASYRNELFRVCDYCVVDRDTFEPLLLVELNDSSHKRDDRRLRDEKVAAICEDAGLPLVTFRMGDDLSYSVVKKAVMRAILK